MIAIKTENLSKRYGTLTAVDGISLEVNEGEIFSLLGVNGAGKTTTVKMLTCLSEASGGDAFLLGNSINTEKSAVKALISVSPQESAVASGLTARENLELVARIYGFSKKQTKEKIEKLSSLLSLGDIIDRKAGKLSGGWQRRLSIAMALISEPKILFLDEPTLGLDVIARSELWELIRSFRGKVTVVMTTHYMEEAEELSDRIAIMKDGRILACDTPDNIKEKTGESSIERAFIKIVKGAEK